MKLSFARKVCIIFLALTAGGCSYTLYDQPIRDAYIFIPRTSGHALELTVLQFARQNHFNMKVVANEKDSQVYELSRLDLKIKVDYDPTPIFEERNISMFSLKHEKPNLDLTTHLWFKLKKLLLAVPGATNWRESDLGAPAE